MKNRIHLIGIGGTGLSAIARLLHESGYIVTGSDRELSPLAEELIRDGVKVMVGHAPENISDAEIIVRSSAIPDDNLEVVAALSKNIPVLKRAEFLGQFMESKTSIAIAGTHGKTTTTGLCVWMLEKLNLNPSYIVGSKINQLGTNAHAGDGQYFVIEADEYDRMFLGLRPDISVITYMELDHPDCYPTLEEYYEAFIEFASSTKSGGKVLVCGDHVNLRHLQNQVSNLGINAVSYGFGSFCTYQAANVKLDANGYYSFDFVQNLSHGPKDLYKSVDVLLPGKHNVLNTLAVLSIADLMNLNIEQAGAIVGKFTGTGRRFEIVAEVNEIILIDDYAHHPTEISSTLAAARSRYQNNRIWAVWQPHTFSRTQRMENEFINSFEDADQVIVTEIYASREKIEDYTSRSIVEQMESKKSRFIPNLATVIETLLEEVRPGDVVIVLSAGDANSVNKALAENLSERKA